MEIGQPRLKQIQSSHINPIKRDQASQETTQTTSHVIKPTQQTSNQLNLIIWGAKPTHHYHMGQLTKGSLSTCLANKRDLYPYAI